MHASFLEIVQTIASGLGALLAVRSMVAADLNLVAILRKNVNGNRKMVAAKNVRVERCVLATQAMLFLVGLATLFLAPPPYTTVPQGMERTPTEVDIFRNLAVTRFGMTTASLVLMYLSYRSWLEERIPIQLARRTDRVGLENGSAVAGAASASLAVVAQQAASQAQVVAAVAQDSASAAQDTAALAQDAATDAHAAANEEAQTSGTKP